MIAYAMNLIGRQAVASAVGVSEQGVCEGPNNCSISSTRFGLQ